MVKLSLEMRKRDFVWVGLIVVLLGAGLVFAQWDSAKAMFHSSEDVKITIGGEDYSLQNASDLGLIGGGMKLGTWVDVTSNYGAQQANSDGIIVASGDDSTIIGYTSSSSNPVEKTRSQSYPAGGYWSSITMPVKKDDYWKIEFSPTGRPVKVYWIPIISAGGSSSETTYVSDWKAISTGGSVTFDHGLGTDALRTTLQFKPAAGGPISVAHTSDYAGHGYGVGIYEVSGTQIKVSGGSADLRYWIASGYTGSVAPSSGFVRVIAVAA